MALEDCVAAMKVSGNGTLDCAYGCLGLGTCVQACKFDAIHINAHGVAQVDQSKCTHCMQCAKACPRHVITDVPQRTKATRRSWALTSTPITAAMRLVWRPEQLGQALTGASLARMAAAQPAQPG